MPPVNDRHATPKGIQPQSRPSGADWLSRIGAHDRTGAPTHRDERTVRELQGERDRRLAAGELRLAAELTRWIDEQLAECGRADRCSCSAGGPAPTAIDPGAELK